MWVRLGERVFATMAIPNADRMEEVSPLAAKGKMNRSLVMTCASEHGQDPL